MHIKPIQVNVHTYIFMYMYTDSNTINNILIWIDYVSIKLCFITFCDSKLYHLSKNKQPNGPVLGDERQSSHHMLDS